MKVAIIWRCVGGRVGWVRILLISNTSMSCPRQPIHNLLILRCGEGFPNISLGGRRVLGCVVWRSFEIILLGEHLFRNVAWHHPGNTWGLMNGIFPQNHWQNGAKKISEKFLDLKVNYDLSGQIIGTKPPRWFHPRWQVVHWIPEFSKRQGAENLRRFGSFVGPESSSSDDGGTWWKIWDA